MNHLLSLCEAIYDFDQLIHPQNCVGKSTPNNHPNGCSFSNAFENCSEQPEEVPIENVHKHIQHQACHSSHSDINSLDGTPLLCKGSLCVDKCFLASYFGLVYHLMT